MDLKNKIVLITGGAVRVGRATSLELASAGAKIFCHYNSSEDQADSLKAKIEEKGGTIHTFRYDLSLDDSADKITNTALELFRRIDVLVNNAAIFFKTPLGQVSPTDWDKLHTINLKSVFFLSQKVGMLMKSQKSGKIISIADSGAVTPFPAYIPYSISKTGIITLTKGLAKALAPDVQVNCINPGPVMMPVDMPKDEREYAIEQTLLKREGSGEDVARTIRFLIEGSDYITGSVIPVDGGRMIR